MKSAFVQHLRIDEDIASIESNSKEWALGLLRCFDSIPIGELFVKSAYISNWASMRELLNIGAVTHLRRATVHGLYMAAPTSNTLEAAMAGRICHRPQGRLEYLEVYLVSDTRQAYMSEISNSFI